LNVSHQSVGEKLWDTFKLSHCLLRIGTSAPRRVKPTLNDLGPPALRSSPAVLSSPIALHIFSRSSCFLRRRQQRSARRKTVIIDIRQFWRGRRGHGVKLCRPSLQTQNRPARRLAASLQLSGAWYWPPGAVRLPKPSRLWRNCAAPIGRRYTPICGVEVTRRRRPKT
jgi:hypothetical protein